jgi:biopolymer transport protein ExbB/TolQ
MFHQIAEFFEEGGWGMWPILLHLIFILAIMFERIFVLYIRSSVKKDEIIKLFQVPILKGDLNRVLKVCSTYQYPLARIVHSGVLKVKRSDEEVQAAMDEAYLRELPQIKKRTDYLNLLGNSATLAGLLGTITGLIATFGAISRPDVDPSQRSTMLSKGISEVMNCTAFGLGTGIIGILAFAVLSSKATAIENDINEGTVRVLNLIVANRNKMGDIKEDAA